MPSLRLFALALKYHWDAHCSNPTNMAAAVIGMVINNCIILCGLWAMLFKGRADGNQLTIYFLALNAMVTIAWGFNCFALGGLRSLAEYVEQGQLEPMLSTPRSPLYLISISQSMIPALGDMLQGLCNIFALFYLVGPFMALICLLYTVIAAVGFFSLFLLAGSLPFFLTRSGNLSQLLVECTLSFSFYPADKIFMDRARYFLFLTPAFFTTILPIRAWEMSTWQSGIKALIGVLTFLFFALKVFNSGIKRYQTSSYVTARK